LVEGASFIISIIGKMRSLYLKKDAIHLAAAEYIKTNLFLTCDDNLIKQGIKLNLKIEIMNPIDYIRREIS
jgi:predicted nucleic acid-binding protein